MKNRRDGAIKIASASKQLNVSARSFHNMSRRVSSRCCLERTILNRIFPGGRGGEMKVDGGEEGGTRWKTGGCGEARLLFRCELRLWRKRNVTLSGEDYHKVYTRSPSYKHSRNVESVTEGEPRSCRRIRHRSRWQTILANARAREETFVTSAPAESRLNSKTCGKGIPCGAREADSKMNLQEAAACALNACEPSDALGAPDTPVYLSCKIRVTRRPRGAYIILDFFSRARARGFCVEHRGSRPGKSIPINRRDRPYSRRMRTFVRAPESAFYRAGRDETAEFSGWSAKSGSDDRAGHVLRCIIVERDFHPRFAPPREWASLAWFRFLCSFISSDAYFFSHSSKLLQVKFHLNTVGVTSRASLGHFSDLAPIQNKLSALWIVGWIFILTPEVGDESDVSDVIDRNIPLVSRIHSTFVCKAFALRYPRGDMCFRSFQIKFHYGIFKA